MELLKIVFDTTKHILKVCFTSPIYWIGIGLLLIISVFLHAINLPFLLVWFILILLLVPLQNYVLKRHKSE